MCRMPIEALPQNTVRAIGSTSVISDPYSVVKELVDNAIDASATSLQIEISQNTVDVIQLKDNGHGISPEDQQYVCKRAFTSKIQTLDDLKNVGGSSLGFRGEALASVAEMSGVLAITTRVESEVTGLCLKYGRNGELTGTSRTSHSVGTTVRITDFLKHIPVRRQTALKSATRTLTRIKKLIQAYAIAQPSKRLSVKVLKAKNENNNWSYAPSIDPSLSDAALKVAGTEVSSSCVLKRFYAQSEAEASTENTTYEAVAFLPKPEFDASKINNVGQYISVDGRPLSSNRGIGQEIVKLFKPYVRLAASKNGSSKPVTDPFLCLQIQCPRGTYDVNIEPAKDDLLFEDRQLVLTLVENLFRDHYGELDATGKRASKQNNETISGCDDASTGFGLLMARKPAVDPATEPLICDNPFDDAPAHTPLPQRPIRSSHGVSPDPSSNVIPESSNQSATARTKRSSFVNPWSISKINASFQTPRRERIPLNLTSPNLPSGSPPGPRRGSDSRSLLNSPNLPDLTSPPTSQIASESPVQRRRHQPQPSTDSSPVTNRMSSSRRAERERGRDRYGNGALDTWFQRTTQVSLQQTPAEEAMTREPSDTPLSVLAQQRFGGSADASPNRGQVNGQNDGCSNALSVGDASQHPRQESPGREHQEDHIPESIDSGRGFPVLERWAAQLHEGFDGEPSDLERALDFERRKKEAIQSSRLRYNQDIRSSGSQAVPVSPSPHRSRYLAAKAALTSSQTSITESVSATTLSHDPRSYLIRQHRDNSAEASTHGDKTRKIPTNRLPLERIPDGSELYNLGIICPVDLSAGSNVLKRNTPEDLYLADNEATAFSASDLDACLPFWNERLTLIMTQRYKSRDASKPMSIKLDLAAAISQHLRNIDTNGG
ncbi:DNA mismatch repair protein C-terminal [Penicillium bovifimosum]|uniref:DNA mismatch repair protein C-terminal n=1 Tax=Penicillium bovifimosum TaxID=126998 RepID=A0A9W9KXP8_9EURO|nr:DNA mismatch repair protein C-terminal [Penicillium bovifimosum]KAJ5124945.1 DNA mismatch repair protein C-terminal [Penicillium bovifimosum]